MVLNYFAPTAAKWGKTARSPEQLEREIAQLEALVRQMNPTEKGLDEQRELELLNQLLDRRKEMLLASKQRNKSRP